MAKTTTYTDANSNDDFADAGNWDNGVPVTGDTAVLASGTVASSPNNIPASAVLHWRITGGLDYDFQGQVLAAGTTFVLVSGTAFGYTIWTPPAIGTDGIRVGHTGFNVGGGVSF